jgi:hypothetical protein
MYYFNNWCESGHEGITMKAYQWRLKHSLQEANTLVERLGGDAKAVLDERTQAYYYVVRDGNKIYTTGSQTI